jgi:prophage DNA circulation protein
VNGVTGDPIAIAVTDAFTVAAQAVLTATAASTAAVDPVVGQVTTAILAPTDPTLGVAAFATWGGALPAPSGLQVQVQQQVQQQIIDLVNAAAVLAVAQIYAGTTWQTANAASAAKTQLLGFISAQLIASAASGNDALFQAWMSLSGMAITDLTQRAQNLPSLTSYATTARLPAPVLAQLLYQDGSQGTFLAALNGVIHPGFMPMRGVALSVLPGIGAN